MNTQQDWDPRLCNERSGFLFQHDCDRLPEAQCGKCSKPMCELHTHYVDNEPYCTACAKQDHKQQRRQSGDRRRSHDEDYHDPYFYGDHYYHGYGRYRAGYWGYTHFSNHHDFTSGDAESMMHEADADFETDMSES